MIDLDDHKIDTGVEFVGGSALNNTSDSNMVKDLMSKFNEPLRKELAKYVLEKGKSSANRIMTMRNVYTLGLVECKNIELFCGC